MKWGPKDAVLERSIDSLRAFHPELPIYVHKLPDDATLLDKATMLNVTPFEETLYLDIDTVVMGRLDFGFDMAIRHGLACCICECPWARRYIGIKAPDTIEYNTGVLFFTRKARPIFDAWVARAHETDSSTRKYIDEKKVTMTNCDDQAAFALAAADSPLHPFVLPLNWNFRPFWQRSFWGPIKIWHDYAEPPQSLIDYCKEQSEPESVVRYMTTTV